MVAAINVDASPVLGFSDLTSHAEVAGIGVFWLHCAG